MDDELDEDEEVLDEEVRRDLLQIQWCCSVVKLNAANSKSCSSLECTSCDLVAILKRKLGYKCSAHDLQVLSKSCRQHTLLCEHVYTSSMQIRAPVVWQEEGTEDVDRLAAAGADAEGDGGGGTFSLDEQEDEAEAEPAEAEQGGGLLGDVASWFAPAKGGGGGGTGGSSNSSSSSGGSTVDRGAVAQVRL